MKNHFWAKILNKLGLLNFLNIAFRVKIDQAEIKIPVIGNLGFGNLQLADKDREPWLNKVIRSALKNQPGAFIDVGVNMGQTLLKVKSADPNQEFIGFEPNPICYYYVNKLVKINNVRNCKIIPVGLAEKPVLKKLFLQYDTDPSASLVQNFRDKSFYLSDQYVPVYDGDSIIRSSDLNSISIIKIDVEGAELEVIQGLRSSIAKYQPLILCEILPIYDENTRKGNFRKIRQNSLLKILEEEGYLVCRIYRDGKIAILDTIEIHSDLSLCEYILVSQKRQRFIRLLQQQCYF